jgi:hypothetical protein
LIAVTVSDPRPMKSARISEPSISLTASSGPMTPDFSRREASVIVFRIGYPRFFRLEHRLAIRVRGQEAYDRPNSGRMRVRKPRAPRAAVRDPRKIECRRGGSFHLPRALRYTPQRPLLQRYTRGWDRFLPQIDRLRPYSAIQAPREAARPARHHPVPAPMR